MDYENEQQQYDDDQREYDRERSRSPRGDYRGNGDVRARSASPGGRERPAPPSAPPAEDEEEARNQGSNLFVTGIHPRLSEGDVTQLFEKFGEVEKCNIMRDPHTRESRGFGFVNMATVDQADAAKEKLQGESIEGRTLSIEKARRSKPRTPTPGRYFGPPKHDFRGPPGRGGGRFRDSYDDRRSFAGRRDDYYGSRSYGGGGRRYDDRYDERGYGGSSRGYGGGGYSGRRDRYDDRGPPSDSYHSRRDDRGERRGGGGGGRYYDDREPRRPPPSDAYSSADPVGGGRSYGDAAGGDRYERR